MFSKTYRCTVLVTIRGKDTETIDNAMDAIRIDATLCKRAPKGARIMEVIQEDYTLEKG